MLLPDLSIKRPVFALMITGAVTVFGLIALGRLPVREMPAMDFPVVNVTVEYPGAGPEVVDLDVVEPLVEELNTIPGVRRLETVSVDGATRIDMEFELERDIDAAAQDVRERIARVRPRLPRRMKEPLVAKLDLDAQPIVWLALSSSKQTVVETTDYWDRVLKPRFERIEGLGQFLRAGAQRFAVRVWIDPAELAARRLTVTDVMAALADQNVQLPAGRLEGTSREFPVTLSGRASDIDAIGAVVVADHEGAPVFLRDVARVAPGAEDERATARLSILPDAIGREAVGIGIIKQTDANTVDVAAQVNELVAELRGSLPAGMSLVVAIDTSTFVRQSISELKEAVIFGALLTVVVVFLFLGSGRATIISAIAIPTSLLGSFVALYLLDFTINTLTMLAVVLVIGEVIDDAILVLENVHRHRQSGLGAVEAARIGTAQVGFAAVASSLTLIIVFAPLAFVTGIVGRMLAEFALTIAVSIGVSIVVALTLIPMLCSRYLHPTAGQRGLGARAERSAEVLAWRYGRLLAGALRRRWIVVCGAIASLALTVVVFMQLGTEASPPVDEGAFVVYLTAPEGATPAYTDGQLRRVESLLQAFPEVDSFLVITAPSFGGIVPKGNEALGLVKLRPLEDRRGHMRSQAEVMAALRTQLAGVPGAVVSVFARPSVLSGSSGAPVQLTVVGPDIDSVHLGAERLRDELARVPGLVDVTTSLRVNKPELLAVPRAQQAAHLGVSTVDVADTMQALLGGSEATTFIRDGQNVPVIVQLAASDRDLAEKVRALPVRARDGGLVPLGSVVDLRETVDVNEVRRYERTRIAYIEAHLDGKPLGEALEEAEEIAARVLPPGVEARPVGAAMGMEESFQSLIFTFLIATLATYMLLASQFNHLGHPLAIMAAIPLGMFGAVLALWIWGITLNLYSGIGILMLMGLVVKNSIILIDYTNTLRAEGMARDEALVTAGRVRLRPILMTAAANVLSVLPAIVGLGVGSETRQPLVVAVFGGMLLSTVLTLVVVPVAYSILDDWGRGLGRLWLRLTRRASS